MTPAALPNVLSVDDLAANRAGRLTDHQRTSWVGFEQAWTSGLRLEIRMDGLGLPFRREAG